MPRSPPWSSARRWRRSCRSQLGPRHAVPAARTQQVRPSGQHRPAHLQIGASLMKAPFLHHLFLSCGAAFLTLRAVELTPAGQRFLKVDRVPNIKPRCCSGNAAGAVGPQVTSERCRKEIQSALPDVQDCCNPVVECTWKWQSPRFIPFSQSLTFFLGPYRCCTGTTAAPHDGGGGGALSSESLAGSVGSIVAQLRAQSLASAAAGRPRGSPGPSAGSAPAAARRAAPAPHPGSKQRDGKLRGSSPSHSRSRHESRRSRSSRSPSRSHRKEKHRDRCSDQGGPAAGENGGSRRGSGGAGGKQHRAANRGGEKRVHSPGSDHSRRKRGRRNRSSS